jgi:hypothetical protein
MVNRLLILFGIWEFLSGLLLGFAVRGMLEHGHHMPKWWR